MWNGQIRAAGPLVGSIVVCAAFTFGVEAASAQDAPRGREITDTPAGQVGTLPEGVGLAVGTEVPGLIGTDHDGRPIELGKLLEAGEVLVVFYRGGWCPYCNFQIRELTEAYPELEKRGLTPVAVSVDRIEQAAKTQASYSIPFPVVADPKLEWHRAFRVLNELDEAQVGRLKGFGIDLEAHSGETHHTIAVPAIFLIGHDGRIRWAHADHDYKVRPRLKTLLAALDALEPST